MALAVFLAFWGGALVVLSRQVNGRLALSTSALESSFWNHVIGLLAVSLAALAVGSLFGPQTGQAPWWAYLGGPIGVVFIAAGSWLIARIGAAQTAMLIIAGQMVSGVILDLIRGAPGNLTARIVGVGLIFAGMWLTRKPAPPPKV
jgi:transporter family-2 protein